MNPGTYQGVATVVATGAANSPITIPVTLTIGSSTLYTVNPSFLNFNYQIGQQAPTPQMPLLSAALEHPFHSPCRFSLHNPTARNS